MHVYCRREWGWSRQQPWYVQVCAITSAHRDFSGASWLFWLLRLINTLSYLLTSLFSTCRYLFWFYRCRFFNLANNRCCNFLLFIYYSCSYHSVSKKNNNPSNFFIRQNFARLLQKYSVFFCKFCLNRLRFSYFIMQRVGLHCLPRDDMHKRGLCCHAVSVRLPVCKVK